MEKWFGKVGYAVTSETSTGVWKEQIVERSYYGEVVKNYRKLQSENKVNDNVNVANEISIVSDPFANENFHAIRYVEFMGNNWKVSGIDVQFPRLVLTIGDLYSAIGHCRAIKIEYHTSLSR